MEEPMGYKNQSAVYRLSRQGRLAKPRGGKLTVNTMAMNVLLYMAHNTYDWDPDANRPVDGVPSGVPCRYYTKGWRSVAEDLGMMILSDVQLLNGTADDADTALEARARTAQTRISAAWKFLRDQGLIKQLVPASLGKNAGYLLLLGDDKENRAVERYARECLGLPFMRE